MNGSFDGDADFFQTIPATTSRASVFRDYRLADDTCTVRTVGGFVTYDTTLNHRLISDAEENAPILDAGNTLPFVAGIGAIDTFNRKKHIVADDYFYSWKTNEDLYGSSLIYEPLPADTVVDVAGRTFPAVFNVQVTNVDRSTFIRPESLRGPADLPIRWIPGNNPDARIQIYDVFDDTNRSVQHLVKCMVLDDGEFVYPQNVQQPVGDTVANTFPGMARVAFEIRQQGESVMVVMSRASR